MQDQPDDECDLRIAQALRLGVLRKDVMDHIDGPAFEGGTGNLPMDTQECFWEHVLAFETAEEATFFERLRTEAGFVPINPELLDGPDTTKQALWALLEALASIRVFIFGTDHLSDTELYRLLLNGALPEVTTVPPKDFGLNCRIDATAFGTSDDPEGTQIWLRYYADERTREEWEGEIPPKERPPYDRDRYLPIPPEER